MAANIYWINEPFVIGVQYSGNVTGEDIQNVADRCLPLMDDQTVYFLIDLSQANSIPSNVFKIGPLLKMTGHPNVRWFAFVQPDRFAKFAIQVLLRNRVKVFSTPEEASAFLLERFRTEMQPT
jgi:tricorn protease-like protein